MSQKTPYPVGDPTASSGLEPPKVGDKIGSYRLVRLIGEGAAGRVFEVEHMKIGRRAAMKILAPEHAERPGAIKRLFSEAHAVNKISHPHIVEVTDLLQAEREGEVNAIVMELLEGRSLGEAMQAETLPPEIYLPILSEVAGALAAAHAAQFVHRDLKPDNIFLTSRAGQRNYVKLLDFGLAKSIAGDLAPKQPEASTLMSATPPPMGVVESHRQASRTIIHATADGTFVGTPAYASPEQAAGKALDHRTDIYSLGVIMYELLCGRLPFEGKTFGEYLVKHITTPVPAPPAGVLKSPLGRALFSVAVRCLAKRPEDRWSTAAELKDLFDKLTRGAHTAAATALANASRPASAVPAMGVLVVGIAALGGLIAFFGPDRTPQAPPIAPTSPPAESMPQRPMVVRLPERIVDINFHSEPEGAETRVVARDGVVGEVLGLTPFHHTYPADGSRLEVEMRLPGFLPRRDSIVLSQDGKAGGALRRLSPPPVETTRKEPAEHGRSHPRAPAKPKVTRGTTLNPFSK